MMTSDSATTPSRPRTIQRVVCVDDEPLIRRALHRLLGHEPYELFITGTPGQALEYVRDHEVQLVVADQIMPGITGMEFLKMVRELSPATRGVILTGYPASVLEEAAADEEIPPLLVKPWDDETLREAISEFLRPADDPTPATDAKAVSAPAVRFSTLLVPLDGTGASETALAAAVPLVSFLPDPKIVLIRAIGDDSSQSAAGESMSQIRQGLIAQGLWSIFWVRMGEPAEQILECARSCKADLIVMATHGKRRISSFFRGSITEQVLRGADVPVLVCRPGMNFLSWSRILVPLDGSPASESILPTAAALARSVEASLCLVHVAAPGIWTSGIDLMPGTVIPILRDPGGYLNRVASALRSDGFEVETAVLDGSPARELCRFAEGRADLLCMAGRVRWGLGRLLGGSVTGDLLSSAPCPVLVRSLRPAHRSAS
ncbi:MAG: universal stress protein [Planctomycetes bacterium]|nr:universal stress protein [Planctomycetota bacterium]